MTLANAGELINEAYVQLQDNRLRQRWSETELINYLNQGVEEAVALRPGLGSTHEVVELVAGTRQALPEDGIRLLDVPRNMPGGAPGRGIRQVSRDNLDGADPDWHLAAEVSEIFEFTYDAKREPKGFFVNPPAADGTQVEVVYAKVPGYVSTSTGWETDEIPLDDVYNSALLNYVLYRAFNKEEEYAAEQGRALLHLRQFYNLIGRKDRADKLGAPIEHHHNDKTQVQRREDEI